MNSLAAVIVETRPEKLKIALENHLYFLPKGTSVYLFTDIKKYIDDYYEGFNFYFYQIDSMNESEYNKLLTSQKFWNTFEEENILIFQHDSMLLREGIDEFYEWDFIGAPILKIPGCMNGGLSLRKKSAMLRVLEKFTYNNSTDGNEDVWYVAKLKETGGKLPTVECAKNFSTETIYSLNTLGCHAIDRYLSREQCQKIKTQYAARNMDTNSEICRNI